MKHAKCFEPNWKCRVFSSFFLDNPLIPICLRMFRLDAHSAIGVPLQNLALSYSKDNSHHQKQESCFDEEWLPWPRMWCNLFCTWLEGLSANINRCVLLLKYENRCKSWQKGCSATTFLSTFRIVACNINSAINSLYCRIYISFSIRWKMLRDLS